MGVTEDGEVVRRDPRRWGRRPNRRVGSANEVKPGICGEGPEHTLVPTLLDLLVIIDHADELCGSGLDPGVERARLPAPAFADDLYTTPMPCCHPLQQLRCAVSRAVVDRDDGDGQALGHTRAQERFDRPGEQSCAVPCGY